MSGKMEDITYRSAMVQFTTEYAEVTEFKLFRN